MSDDLPAPVRPTIPTCKRSSCEHPAQIILHFILDTNSLMYNIERLNILFLNCL
jgi:hypothetical protein